MFPVQVFSDTENCMPPGEFTYISTSDFSTFKDNVVSKAVEELLTVSHMLLKGEMIRMSLFSMFLLSMGRSQKVVFDLSSPIFEVDLNVFGSCWLLEVNTKHNTCTRSFPLIPGKNLNLKTFERFKAALVSFSYDFFRLNATATI